MALPRSRTEQAQGTGHVSHDAQVRIDTRVKRILARRQPGRPAAPAATTRANEGRRGNGRKG